MAIWSHLSPKATNSLREKYGRPTIIDDLDAIELGPPQWDYWGLKAQPQQWLADLITAKRIKAGIIGELAKEG